MFDEPVPPRLVTGLAKLATAMRSQAWEQAARRRLTPTQATALRLLAARPEGLRVGELADQLGVTAQTASDSAAALLRKRLVRKSVDPADRRVTRLHLTEAGEAEARQVAAWPDALLTALADLDPDEQRVMMRVVVKLIRGMQERGQMPVARVCVTCRFFMPYAHPAPSPPHHCRFVDAAFGDEQLKIDCPDHSAADSATRADLWRRFTTRAA
ncbi:MAG: MarR family transcriptional regulator [Micromonosporaceae bacterium]|jgi:DNA-binding MarR family transcriptional regulator